MEEKKTQLPTYPQFKPNEEFGEFVNRVLKERPYDRGDIAFFHYENGRLRDEIPENIKHMHIYKVVVDVLVDSVTYVDYTVWTKENDIIK